MALTNAETRARYKARHPERVRESHRKHDKKRVHRRVYIHPGPGGRMRMPDDLTAAAARLVVAHQHRKLEAAQAAERKEARGN